MSTNYGTEIKNSFKIGLNTIILSIKIMKQHVYFECDILFLSALETHFFLRTFSEQLS
jgi:hypothetical protein